MEPEVILVRFKLHHMAWLIQNWDAATMLGTVAAIGVSYFALKSVRRSTAVRNLDDSEGSQRRKAALFLESRGNQLLNLLNKLRASLQGALILPTDKDELAYNRSRRRVFNQSQRGFPLAIAQPECVADVVACVGFIRDLPQSFKLPFNVMSGGHSSKCMMDGAFVVDLVKLNRVTLNKELTQVTVEGGAYVEDIDKVLAPHNLGVPVGTYPKTGVGGMALGGGHGWLSRMHGFLVDNFIEVEVVLLSSQVVIANAMENSDLFWGVRGGSGNFGIVTKFTFKVHVLPPHCIAGTIVKLTPTLASAVQVCSNFDKAILNFGNNSSAMLMLPAGGSVVPIMFAHFGEENSPLEVADYNQLTNIGGWLAIQNTVKQCSYHNDLQRATKELISSGHIYHSLIQFGSYGEHLPSEFFAKLLAFIRKPLPSSLNEATFIVFAMGGAMQTSDENETETSIPAAVRQCKYFGIFSVLWSPEYSDVGQAAARQWCQKVIDIVKPFSTSTLRYAPTDKSNADVHSIYQCGYSEDLMQRLGRLKYEVDPRNILRHNTNVLPISK